MSYNGNGVFNINTAGQPVVAGTVISSTAFNALTADLAGGLSTAITKDGQTTPTANIPMGNYKITNLGAGTVTTDAVRLGQLQTGSFNLLSISGIDTLTASLNPALNAYGAGNAFYFVVGSTNTGAMTINIDSLGAKAITRTGSTALVAGDLVAGQIAYIVYDGTRFQLLDGNSFTNLHVSNNLDVDQIINDKFGDVRDIPQSGTAKTTSYTLTTADIGQYIQIGSGGSIVIPNSTFSAGNAISLFNNTSSNVTITCSTTNAYIPGIDVNKSSVTLATRGIATILFITSTLCVISGTVT